MRRHISTHLHIYTYSLVNARDSASVLRAPVNTIFPLTKISMTTFGSTMRYTKPGKSSGSYVDTELLAKDSPSMRMGKPTSHVAVMFCTLNSRNSAGKPTFCTMAVYFLPAFMASSSLRAPVMIIFPEAKMRAVVRGSRMRMMTAWKRFGLYSALRAV